MSHATQTPDAATPNQADLQGWVLYDGSCGFCARWVPFWGSTLQRLHLGSAPLQADWVRSRLGATDEDLLSDLRLLLREGAQLRGPDVYRYVFKRLWWAWPVYVLSIIPIGRQVFDWAYRTFARNRYRVSQACGLKPPK
jgi:predicted DCC family thiol-disulfide oxidoreductase YuxK